MDGLQVFQAEDGTYNGHCFACGTSVADPYNDRPVGYKPNVKKKSPEEVQQELDEIAECEAVNLVDRKLPKKALEQFGIVIGLSQKDGKTPALHYYPYYHNGKLVRYKARVISSKTMFSVGDTGDVDLFGWEQAKKTGSKKLFITEGECDAVALFTIIMKNQKREYKDNLPAIVSLPTGAGAAKNYLSKQLPKIRKHFKEVVLVFDNDDAGQKAVQEVMTIAPDFTVATLPCKDANDCLVEGVSKAAFNAVMFNSSKPKNTRLVWGEDLVEAGRVEAEWGVSWPWDSLSNLTRGIRTGETIYIGAGVKMGKSEVVNALAEHLIRKHGWKVMLAKPEEANAKTFKLLVGKAAGKIFHDPTKPFDYDAYDEFAPKIAKNVCMVNLYQHLGWETLKGDIVAAAAAGCKAIIIDPITSLMPENAAEANEALQAIGKELAAMAMDLNIVVFIFCHLKAPSQGEPHERGGKVLSNQFAGSRAMMRSCNYMLGMQGNKDPELPLEERNLRQLVVLEDREFGNTGIVNLYWDHHTGLFNEIKGN